MTLTDPETIFIQQGVIFDSRSSINPNVQITEKTVIGPFFNLSGCRIGVSETVKPLTTIIKG